MSEVWFFSDSHFGHRRIAGYENRPADHEERMWQGLSLVQEGDSFVHVGDVVLDSPSEAVKVLERLPGQRKILVEGNHDKRYKKIRRWEGWDEVHRYKEVWITRFGGIRFAISHRPHEIHLMTGWAEVYLHGHVHSKRAKFRWGEDEKGRKRLYVNACVEVNDYKPISLTEIKEEYERGPV